jgi:hypothetical protein
MPRTISATYGGFMTPCTVFVYDRWYAVEGSHNVNRAPSDDELTDGVDIETIQDVDTFTSGEPIDSEETLEREADE